MASGAILESNAVKAPTIKSRWLKLDGLASKRSALRRARQCAELTIPSLFPPEGSTESMDFETPFQGLGARGVNNIASKLLLSLLPPNSPFFRLKVSEFTLEEMGQGELQTEIEAALSTIEHSVLNEIEAKAYRVVVFETLRLLIVTGNALLYIDEDSRMKVYRLDQYVVRRDPMGNVLEIIVKERVHPSVLPEEIRSKVQTEITHKEEYVDLYTRILREDDQWTVEQECLEEILEDSRGTFPLDECPWLALRWTGSVGEDYGRGHVEEYLGDFLTLESLTKAVTEGSVAAARVIHLVDPNGVTSPRRLINAPNLSVIEGRAQDVTTLQLDKFADFRIAYEMINKIEQRISYAFLLMQSVQRDAERVTAEEIRTLASELEDSLGGVYSVLSQEFQLPLVQVLLAQMSKRGDLPRLPNDVVQPSIVTGLEALGRGNDYNKLMLFIDSTNALPEERKMYLEFHDLFQRIATSLGINSKGLIKTPEQVEAEIAQMQMAAMTQQAIPGMAQEVTKGMMTQNVGADAEGV